MDMGHGRRSSVGSRVDPVMLYGYYPSPPTTPQIPFGVNAARLPGQLELSQLVRGYTTSAPMSSLRKSVETAKLIEQLAVACSRFLFQGQILPRLVRRSWHDLGMILGPSWHLPSDWTERSKAGGRYPRKRQETELERGFAWEFAPASTSFLPSHRVVRSTRTI